ncbi:MAG: HEPN domain-containing protein [Chloroflexi bacterium]|nr:HEPN domain-containing protein [Chloroflexota bacterium]
MTFNWAEYLSVAQTLCGRSVSGPTPSSEALQRSAVSRAYYAAFGEARNHLRDSDGVITPATHNIHRMAAGIFLDSPDERRVRIGTNLRRLRDARNECDYDDEVSDLPQVAQDSIEQAAQILTILPKL